MNPEAHRYVVVLRHTAGGEAAGRSAEVEQVTLFSAASHDAIVASPGLGELVAEAAFNSWRQRQIVQVAVCAPRDASH